MQSSSSSSNPIKSIPSRLKPTAARLLETPKSKQITAQDKQQSEVKAGISKSLTSVNSAKSAAGVNRGAAVSKTAMYTAAILSELNRRSENLGASFLKHFQNNLLITKQCNTEAIKPAAHQSLNDMVRQSLISLDDAKQITHAAWKLVYKDIPSLESKKYTDSKSNSAKISARIGGGTHSLESVSNHSSQISESEIKSTGDGQRIDAPSGFLWKPISDSPPHGLAILLPSAWTGKVEEIEIIDPESEEVLATSQVGGRGDGGVGNGERQHFRFPQQGGEFPSGALVKVHFKDGSEAEISIEDTGSRTEGRA